MTQYRNSILTGLCAKKPKKPKATQSKPQSKPQATLPNDIDENTLGQMLGLDSTKEDNEKTISAGHHTLTVNKQELDNSEMVIDTEQIEQMKQSGALPADFAQEFIVIDLPPTEKEHDEYNLYLGDFMVKSQDDQMSNSDATNLNLMLSMIKKANIEDEMVINIDSNGGSIDEGLRFMYAIRRTFDAEKITTILAPKGYSMGSHIFTIGHTRVVYEDGAVMLHDYSTGVGGKASVIKDYIEHSEARLNELAYSSYVTPGYITKEEYAEYKIGKELWFTASEMVTRGIATHVILRNGTVVSAEEFVKINSEQKRLS